MTSWKRKIAVAAGECFGRDLMRKVSDFTSELENWTSKNPFNAKNANPVDEDEYMKNYGKKKINISLPSRKPNISSKIPSLKDEMNWSEEDLKKVMQSKNYWQDAKIQEKVKSYFEKKYPG